MSVEWWRNMKPLARELERRTWMPALRAAYEERLAKLLAERVPHAEMAAFEETLRVETKRRADELAALHTKAEDEREARRRGQR